MLYRIKPEFIDLWGDDANEETTVTGSELETFSSEWEMSKSDLLEQLIPVGVKEATAELKSQMNHVEKLAKRGLLSPRETEQRITGFIDDILADYVLRSREENIKLEEARRLADRRKWRFLLSLTKERCE